MIIKSYLVLKMTNFDKSFQMVSYGHDATFLVDVYELIYHYFVVILHLSVYVWFIKKKLFIEGL